MRLRDERRAPDYTTARRPARTRGQPRKLAERGLTDDDLVLGNDLDRAVFGDVDDAAAHDRPVWHVNEDLITWTPSWFRLVRGRQACANQQRPVQGTTSGQRPRPMSHAFEVCRPASSGDRLQLVGRLRSPVARSGRARTPANECHEAGGLPPGARLLVLARRSVSEGGRLSSCTSGWT